MVRANEVTMSKNRRCSAPMPTNGKGSTQKNTGKKGK